MSQPVWSKIETLMLQLTRRAGDLLARKIAGPRQVEYKSDTDLVTEMDRRIEALFLSQIRRTFPDHDVLSEEMAFKHQVPLAPPSQANAVRWIIDPIDGTTNYAHGFPHFAVSVGIEHRRQLIMGAVYNPMLKDFFFARLGKGAWRNQKPIRVSSVRQLKHALLGTGFPYDLRTSLENNFKEFERLSHLGQAIRRAGSASLDLCDVACGRFDGFWEYKLKPWDLAGAAVILREAGGKMTNLGKPSFTIYDGAVAASNGLLHTALQGALSSSRNAFSNLGKSNSKAAKGGSHGEER